MEMAKEQKAVLAAFGDAIKAERSAFTEEGIRILEDLIIHTVNRALGSVSDLECEEEDRLKEYLVGRMKEYTRRGLQRAIKGIARECDKEE